MGQNLYDSYVQNNYVYILMEELMRKIAMGVYIDGVVSFLGCWNWVGVDDLLCKHEEGWSYQTFTQQLWQ